MRNPPLAVTLSGTTGRAVAMATLLYLEILTCSPDSFIFPHLSVSFSLWVSICG